MHELETVSEEHAADILEEMPPDEAADLLSELPEMGTHVNSRSFNVIAWGTSGIMIVLTLVMVGSLVVGY